MRGELGTVQLLPTLAKHLMPCFWRADTNLKARNFLARSYFNLKRVKPEILFFLECAIGFIAGAFHEKELYGHVFGQCFKGQLCATQLRRAERENRAAKECCISGGAGS